MHYLRNYHELKIILLNLRFYQIGQSKAFFAIQNNWKILKFCLIFYLFILFKIKKKY